MKKSLVLGPIPDVNLSLYSRNLIAAKVRPQLMAPANNHGATAAAPAAHGSDAEGDQQGTGQ